MSVIEQVKELRIAAAYKEHSLKILLEQAADAIEALSAKLAGDNDVWIYDRVPTKEECGSWRGKFLVTVYANEPTTMYMEYEYAKIRGKEVGRWLWHDRVNIPWEVIAWKKFPEPYRP